MYVISNTFYSYPDPILDDPIFVTEQSEIASAIVTKIISDLQEMIDSDYTPKKFRTAPDKFQFDPENKNYHKILEICFTDHTQTYRPPYITPKIFKDCDVNRAYGIKFNLITDNAEDEIAWDFIVTEVPKENL